ncbi:MAG TPA: MoaD/ThiS family protein [Verrucomicrobiae bacterium]
MKILFFAHLKTVTGQAELGLSLNEPVDANTLWERLIALHPGLARYRPSVRLAQNGEYIGSKAQFSDIDEVALIPPVSGG